MSTKEKTSLFRALVMFSVFVLLFLSGLIALSVTRHIADVGLASREAVDASPVFPNMKVVNQWILWTHITTGLPPLLIGLFGFFRGVVRSRFRGLHRLSGTIYVYLIFVSSVTGLMLATANETGLMSKLGFGTLAIVWFSTTYKGWSAARNKEFVKHREWMIRSYLVTCAVITIRLLPTPEGIDRAEWLPYLTWLCWVPNLIIAELYIRFSTFRGRFRIPEFLRERWLKST